MGERNTIHVTGFPAGTRATELAPQFERAGNLIRIDMPPLGRFKSIPYAFVEYESMQDAENAIRTLDQQPVDFDGNYVLRVQMARSRPRTYRDVRERDPRDMRGPRERHTPRSYRDYDDRRFARYRGDERIVAPRRYDERRGPPRSYGPPRGYDERLGEPKPYEQALRGTPIMSNTDKTSKIPVQPEHNSVRLEPKESTSSVTAQPSSPDTMGSSYEPQDQDMNHLTESTYTQHTIQSESFTESTLHEKINPLPSQSQPHVDDTSDTIHHESSEQKGQLTEN